MPRSWPVTTFIGDFTAGPPNPPSRSSVDLQAGRTALRQVATQRGRQYELGVVQAGTMTVDLTDSSEYLNPASTTSPWNTGSNTLLPYRCTQFGAYWNPATLSAAGNIFNSTNRPAYAAGSNLNTYDPSFESGLGPLVFGAGSPTIALSTAQKFDGLQSAAVTFTATADIVQITAPFLNPGAPVTFSVYVYAPAGTTLNVAMGNAAAGGATIASAASAGSGAWQRLVVTGAPSAPTVVWRFSVTGTAAATVYLDAMQLEFGSTASAFTTSGPTWNGVFTGYIERYPQTWDSAGFRGLKPLVSVDALSPLSRIPIRQSYAQTIAADGPQVYVPYSDQAFPQAVQLPTGGQQMIGYQQLGSQSASANFGGDTFLDGSRAVSIVQQNTSPVTLSDNTQVTYIGTRQGSVTMNTTAFTIETWVKVSSGVTYLGAAAMGAGESTVGEVTGPLKYIGWYTSGGQLQFRFTDPNGGTAGFSFNPASPWLGYPDGKWHYLAITVFGGSFTYVVDTRVSPTGSWGFTPSPAISLGNFFAEPTTYFGDPISQIAVANMAVYPTVLTAAQFAAHYKRGIGYLGELSGTRANRLLTQYWGSNIVTDTGKTAMSTDFYYSPPSTPGTASQPKQALAVLQDIAATEGGLLWADGAGKVHFDSRETRYTNSPTARFTFGENVAGGELPYDGGLRYEYDGTYVYSEADLTGGTGTQLPPIVNTTSQTNYGQRILSATLFMASDWDVQQAGQFYVQRYAAPPGGRGSTAPMRISKITINPAENPNLWQAALSLDIGHRITVKRRTSPGTTMTGDYYIEQVSHNVNAAASTWTVDYQLSPVWNPQVWILGDNAKGVLGSTSICVY